MKNLQDATERICELKGSLVALDALLPAVIDTLSAAGLSRLSASFDAHAEVARTVMLHSDMSDVVLAAFEREVLRNGALLRRSLKASEPLPQAPGLDPMLMAITPVSAHAGTQQVGQASGFFFRRGAQVFLVSARSVMAGQADSPAPDRLDIELAVDAMDPARRETCVLPLVNGEKPLWRGMRDAQGPVDVAVLPIAPSDLPKHALWLAFDETHLTAQGEDIAIGDVVSMVGFPQGLSLPRRPLPIARTGSLASPLQMRVQDRDCFLTDVLSGAGCEGAPVLRRRAISRSASAPVAWQLLGIHTRLGVEPDTAAPQASLLASLQSSLQSSLQTSLPALHRTWSADTLLALTADIEPQA